jgi:mono/diheme cytochrome c family protein
MPARHLPSRLCLRPDQKKVILAMRSLTLHALVLGGMLSLVPLASAQTPAPAPAPASPAAPAAEPAPEASSEETPTVAEDADISGEEEFIRYCSVCHGIDAKGKGALAGSLKKPPADLTRIAKRNEGHFPFSKVAGIIRDGGGITSHGSTDMPAWGEVFRDHTDPIMARALIFELTLYLESLQQE